MKKIRFTVDNNLVELTISEKGDVEVRPTAPVRESVVFNPVVMSLTDIALDYFYESAENLVVRFNEATNVKAFVPTTMNG